MRLARPKWLLATLCLLVAVSHAHADAPHADEASACDAKSARTTITDPDAYARILHCRFKGTKPRVRGLMARVLKGKSDRDFETLSDDPDRKIVFVMGSDGLQTLIGSTNDQILDKIGYTADYVSRLEQAGYRFKLVVFESGSNAPKLATWDHVIELAASNYPDVAAKLRAAKPRLERTTFAKIEAQAPTKFAVVDSAGRDHADYIDEARLKSSDGALWQVRAFLYYQLRLTDLYAGDGSTRTAAHKKGLKEYIAPNTAIRDLSGAKLIDL